MKKHSRLWLAALLCLILAFAAACGPSVTQPGGSPEPSAPTPSGNGDVQYAADYDPVTFSKDGLSYEATPLGDGVRMVENRYSLASGKPVVVYATEIDLTKAEIRAASSYPEDGSASLVNKRVPYKHMTEWEKANPGQKVMFATNADFFGSTCVNAFVKDGKIIKNAHNDNGSYDYRSDASDVPASAPMLFGVSESRAQIAPMKKYEGDITDPAVKKGVVQSKLFYSASFGEGEAAHTVKPNQKPYFEEEGVCYLTEQSAFRCKAGSVVFKVQVDESELSGTVESAEVLSSDGAVTPEEGKAVFVASPAYPKLRALKAVAAGEKFSLSVASEDGTWNGFTTILGCRHALITGGEIPPTVALESSNGASRTNIPRTAVGIKEDGTVVVFSVEALTYGKFGTDADTFGLSLSELADFARYYGCLDAANFDGGGSTQTIVRGGYNGSGDPKVVVRSSDTGSTELAESRPVINAILVTAAKERF